MKINISNARIAFCSLFEPREQLNGSMKFDANFILTAQDKAKVEAAVKAVAKEKFKAGYDARYKKLTSSRLCLRDGDENTNKSGEVYDGFAGAHYVVAKSAKRPLVIGPDKSPLVAADGKPYAGCYVNASIELYAVEGQKSGGDGVFAELKGVQFVKDGDAFGGGAPASPDDFENLEEGSQEESLV